MGQICPTQLISCIFCEIHIAHRSIIRHLELMIAGNLGAGLPEMVAGHHRAAVFVDVSISSSTIRVIWTTGQRQTGYLPAMLVKQNKHRLDFCRHQLERRSHLDGLEHMFLLQELLGSGGSLTRTGIIVMYPRGGIGPSLIGVPS